MFPGETHGRQLASQARPYQSYTGHRSCQGASDGRGDDQKAELAEAVTYWPETVPHRIMLDTTSVWPHRSCVQLGLKLMCSVDDFQITPAGVSCNSTLEAKTESQLDV